MTIIGDINGKNGTYQVYHLAPSDHSLYYKNSAGSSCATGFTKTSSGFSGPDGSSYSNAPSVLAAIEARHRAGKI